MPLLFRGVDPAEYGPLAAQAIKVAMETRTAENLAQQEGYEHLNAVETIEQFWRCYEASQLRVAALKGYHQRLDQSKPSGPMAWTYHSWITKYINAVAMRTDSSNNLLVSRLEGQTRDTARYEKQQDMLEKSVAQQTGYLVWSMNDLLNDHPVLAQQLWITPDLPILIANETECDYRWEFNP